MGSLAGPQTGPAAVPESVLVGSESGSATESPGSVADEQRRLVVAAAIVDDLARPRRLLAARRTGPPALAGRWEFPGGKVEPGEDPVAALHREIAEELGLTVTLGDELLPDAVDGPCWRLSPAWEMRLWLAEITAGEVDGSTDHDLLRWVDADDLPGLDWLPGDRAAIGLLVSVLTTP